MSTKINKNKKIYLIGCSIILVAALAIIIALCVQNSENNNTTKNPELENGWREIPPKVNDYDYGYDLKDDYKITGEDGKEYTVIDIIKLFTRKPSFNVKTEDREEELDDAFDEVFKDDAYKNNYLTKEEIAEKEAYGEEPWGTKNIECDLSKYNQISGQTTDFVFEYTIKENEMKYNLIKSHYKTENDYFQVCYDAMVAILTELETVQERQMAIIAKADYVDMSAMFKAIEEENYRVIFDGLMSDVLLIAYNKDGIFTRIEYGGGWYYEDTEFVEVLRHIDLV